jgi:putative ubiquitin-RnfH superfamily antitoxin RatB of RatAB toxin-antitoxin module
MKELTMEQINLRKANAIQSEIRKAISSSGVQDTLSITEFTTNVDGVLEKAMADFATDVTRKVALNTALFNIRKSVAQANANMGISDILADVELIDAKMAVYSNVATKTVAKSLAEINARLEKLKAAPQEARHSLYGDRFSNVDTSVVEQSTIDGAKLIVKQLKREKQALQDKLLGLNVNTVINIDLVDEMVLKVEGIL